MIWEILVFVSIGIGTYLFYYYLFKKSGLPPGPLPLPYIGNLIQLGLHVWKSFARLSKKYGPIMGVWMGPEKCIVLSSANLIREAYNEPAFSGRFKREVMQFIIGDKHGIIESEGALWVEKRRFALKNLSDFGLGKSCMEGFILEEVGELIDWLKTQNGQPVTLLRRFSLATVNSLWRIICSERYPHDDERLIKILDDLEAAGKILFKSSIYKTILLYFYPGVSKLFPNWSGWAQLVEIRKTRIELFTQIVAEHRTTFQIGHSRDFVDAYLNEIEKTEDPNSSFYFENADKALISVINDLFTAGSDTTSGSLDWLMLYLLSYPEVKLKMQCEIDSVIGRTRLPSLKDRKSLPYTEAVIMETLRKSSITGIGLPHCTTEDTTFHGYRIKKGTQIVGNLYGVHKDPEVFPDPENFQPERFLTPDQQRVIKHEALLAFSTGKRICPGKTLAEDTIFLFATSIVQNFDFEHEPGVESISLNYVRKITLSAPDWKIVMKERK